MSFKKGNLTAADLARKSGPHPLSSRYRPGQLSAPYNIHRVLAIRAKQRAIQGISNLVRELGEDVAQNKYDKKRDKIMTSGALNMITTNNTPSGLGLPADKYPSQAAPKFSGIHGRVMVNRRTHPRRYKQDEPCELYGAPPSVNDGGVRTTPNVATLRNDAIKKGGRHYRKAGDKMLQEAYDTAAMTANYSQHGINPFAPVAKTGSGIKKKKKGHMYNDDDSDSSFISTDGEDYDVEMNNTNY